MVFGMTQRNYGVTAKGFKKREKKKERDRRTKKGQERMRSERSERELPQWSQSDEEERPMRDR